MKKVIRLTESDLHRIIKESVKRILKEDSTFDNHIAGNIFDDIIQRGIYRRIQPKQLKDYIMRAYGLNTGEEGVADIVVDKVIKYKLQMEEQYGLTEANWSNALTDPGNEPDDEYEWTDNDEVDLQHEYEKEKRLRESVRTAIMETVVDMDGNVDGIDNKVVDMMGRRAHEDMTEHIKKVYTDENGKPMFDKLTSDVWDSKFDQYITNQKFCRDISVWMVQNRDYTNLTRFNNGIKWRREQLKIKDPDKRETKIDVFLRALKQEAEKLRKE